MLSISIKSSCSKTIARRLYVLNLFIMWKTVLFMLLSVKTIEQFCMNQDGEEVQWWVIMKTPPKKGNGFGYYDSRSTSGIFTYYLTELDSSSTPFGKTIEAFNLMNGSIIAWNDQKPSGATSSTSAHSKGLFAFSTKTLMGFFLTHSLPKFPSVNASHIDLTIHPQEKIYGQHMACFSMTLREMQIMASHLLIIRPYVYSAPIANLPSTQSLYKLSTSQFPVTTKLFESEKINSIFGYTINAIYKHHSMNGSIFEDGLTNFLTISPIVAETWGRPLQAAWCDDKFSVVNVKAIQLGPYSWGEEDDHSKWAIAGETFVCFGDMNRMTSQWKRGGAYYCLTDSSLIQAISLIVTKADQCQIS